MTHGYTICRYHDRTGHQVAVGTIPRDFAPGFPAVPALKEEFDLGPQILSALVPLDEIPYLYYPNEFTMEDDALSRRMMAVTMKRRLKITPIMFPCLVKTFHFDSMSGTNSLIGNQESKMRLGPVYVTGARAQVVRGLLHMRDYFTREGV
jgi:hypothetical protein